MSSSIEPPSKESLFKDEKFKTTKKSENLKPVESETGFEPRLQRLAEDDEAFGCEKVSLIAARAALRVLPLCATEESGLFGLGTGSAQDVVVHILALWRATLGASHYALFTESDVTMMCAAAYAVCDATLDSSDATLDPSGAVSDVDYFASISAAHAISAVSASYTSSAVKAVSTYAVSTSSGPADYAAANSTAFDTDLTFIESNSNWQDLRYAPLWPDAPFGDKSKGDKIIANWDTAIEELIASEDVAKDEAAVDALIKMKHDYHGLLNGGFVEKKTASNANARIEFVADKKHIADIIAGDDRLGRALIVKSLVQRIRSRQQSQHLTVGLFGDWGVGKSTFINILRKKLDEQPVAGNAEFIYGEFDAWSYENTENFQAGITQEIITAFTSYKAQSEKYRRRYLRFEWDFLKKPLIVLEFAYKLNPWRFLFWCASLVVLSMLLFSADIRDGAISLIQSLGLLKSPAVIEGVGIFSGITLAILAWQQFKNTLAQPLTKEWKTYIRLPSYAKHLGELPVMAKQIRMLCDMRLGAQSDAYRKLLFVIDNLDRCDTEGIVKTFEAVKLILDVPNVVVVVAVDQRIALPALACKYEKMAEHHEYDAKAIARDYLAKVINLPLYLPEPDKRSVAEYLAHLWDDTNFVRTLFNEFEPDNAASNNMPGDQGVGGDEAEPKREDDKDQENNESLADIIAHINRVNFEGNYHKWKAEQKSDDLLDVDATIEKEGLNDVQKKAFYEWLIKFNLRNPRQIKRLYNSYNLLQQVGVLDVEEGERDEQQLVLLVALFAIEAIHQNVHLGDQGLNNEKREAKLYLFCRSDTWSVTSGVDDRLLLAIDEVRSLIARKESYKQLDLLVEPFVLPGLFQDDN